MPKKDDANQYEDWKDQDELTPEQEDQIYQDAIKEIEGKEKNSDDPDNPDTPSDDENQDDPENQDDDKKKDDAKDNTNDDSGDDGDSENPDDSDDSDDSEDGDDLTDEQKAEKEQLAQEEARNKQIDDLTIAYAEEHQVSEDDAREIIKGELAIAEKYSNDPLKISRAYRSQQSEFSKVQSENKQLKDQLEYNFLNPPKVKLNGKEYTQEEAQSQIVEAYREAHPDKTEDLENTEVWELARQDINAQQEKVKSQRIREIAEKASKKRVEIISEIIESENKRYLPDIKAFLQETSDIQLVQAADESIKHIITFAKGKHYTKDIREAEEKGYKRGLEEAKILGEKKTISSGKSPVKPRSDVSLSDEQKQRANDMFGGMKLSEKEIYKLYTDYLKQTNQIKE